MKHLWQLTKTGHACKVRVMHLITMAHLGEAQSLIENFCLLKEAPDLYRSKDIILLLTGEGPFEAAVKTAGILPRFDVKKIINLGIAGSLTSDLKFGSIIPVRTLYLLKDQRPDFKTFQCKEAGYDCITSFDRVLSKEKAVQLKGVAKMVDREAWGSAMAAKAAGIPFESFKMISDEAGTLEACELIKEKAHEFSEKLAEFAAELLKVKCEPIEETASLPGFHFTFSTAHQYKNLLRKLSVKLEMPETEVLRSLPLSDLQEKDILPKERTKKLLQIMEGQLDPLKGTLANEAEELMRSFSEAGLQLHLDPKWEQEKVKISFEVKDDEGLNEKAEALKKVSLLKWKNLMNGNFHVE